MPPMFRLIFIISLCLFTMNKFAQDGREKTGNWMMYFGQFRVAKNWSIHSEAQWRNHEILPNMEQMLLRGGVNYHIRQRLMVTAGYAYVSTHPFDKEAMRTISNEHRIWQQVLFRNSAWRLSFEYRLRHEQRWVNTNFRQRARYRLMLTLPLNTPKVEAGSFVIAVYNEFFGKFDPDNVFDRNRLYGAVGYQFSPVLSVQAGILRQHIAEYGKNYLQIALFMSPNISEKILKLPLGL